MDDFDNPFDAAMQPVDNCIIERMGKNVLVEIEGKLKPVRGVFDDPIADVTLPKNAGIFENASPQLFLKSIEIEGLQENNLVKIKVSGRYESFGVLKIGPDDMGSRMVTLSRGAPGKPEPSRKNWSD